jgi:hypothetical protein
MAYSREQQVEDIRCLDATASMLSGRVVGERQAECEKYLGDYTRIARYFVAWDKERKVQSNTHFSRQVARMFQEIALAPKIEGFLVADYAQLLKVVRRKVRGMLMMRRKKLITCAWPDFHPQPCSCANLTRYRAEQRGQDALL